MNDTISAVQKTLVALDREDLEVFIIRECIADKSLADRFVALGAGVVFEAKASDYSARIRELIDEYGGRKGFISYNASFDFSREAMRILDEAEDAAAEGKWDVAFAVLRGVSGMAVELADSSERQDRVFAVLDRIEPDSGSDWHAKYIRDKARSYRMDLMSRCGSPEEQRAYMYANVDNSEFREKLLRMAWEEGDFDEVLRLALQGEKADREFAGLVTNWRRWNSTTYSAVHGMYCGLLPEICDTNPKPKVCQY